MYHQTIPDVVDTGLPLETFVHTDHLHCTTHTSDQTTDKGGCQNYFSCLNTGIFRKCTVNTGDSYLITEGSLLHQEHHKEYRSDHDHKSPVHAGSLDQIAQSCGIQEIGAAPLTGLFKQVSADDGITHIVKNGVKHNRKHRRIHTGIFFKNNRQHGDQSANDRCYQNQCTLMYNVR